MRRGWTTALCGLLAGALCACSASQNIEVYQTSVKLAQVMHMQVNEKDTLAYTQAGHFAERVRELSNGSLHIEVVRGFPDHRTVSSGEAEFAFLSNIQMAQAVDLFSMLSLPFVYDDASHMSVALNSDEMLALLAERLNGQDLLPMMAVYSGTAGIVTDKGELRVPSDFKELVLAMRTDNSEKIKMFETIGARVLPYSQNSLVSLFGAQVEGAPEDPRLPSDPLVVGAIEVDLDQLQGMLDDASSLYLIRTFHSLSPLWLTVNRQSFESLSVREQAVLREGMAGLLAGMELTRQRQDEKILALAQEQGMTVVDVERPEIGVAIYGATGTGTDKYRPPASFDPRVYQIIQSYS